MKLARRVADRWNFKREEASAIDRAIDGVPRMSADFARSWSNLRTDSLPFALVFVSDLRCDNFS